MKTSALDPDTLNELRSLQTEGGPDVLFELAKLFVETMSVPVLDLREAVAAKTFEDISSAAHVLKSGSANVGALRLSEISQMLEHAGDTSDAARLPNLMAEFNNEFAVVLEELKRLQVDGPRKT
jgi:HPt (histidine-containing phosphotransfer) domain-containing protein